MTMAKLWIVGGLLFLAAALSFTEAEQEISFPSNARLLRPTNDSKGAGKKANSHRRLCSDSEFWDVLELLFYPTEDPLPPCVCGRPEFVGDWQGAKPYPIPIAEAQGAMIGNDFVLVSGFTNGFSQCTLKNYALDTTNPNADWRELADFPIATGVTHAGFAVVGQKLYMCGGYLGGHPGQHISDCVVYDHSVQPKGKWSSFASLPEGRAGGGMVYDSNRNELIFATGAIRPVAGKADADDQPDTWAYSLSNPGAGWKKKSDIPYVGNHISYVTSKDGSGKERHFFVGGQVDENEKSGNVKDHYEWDSDGEKWIKRADMPFTRGHASSSTRAIGCGYIIAAGSTNNGKTTDISYYDIPTNTWTKIGDMPAFINTPVCDIRGGYLYCESGYNSGEFSYKRAIIVK